MLRKSLSLLALLFVITSSMAGHAANVQVGKTYFTAHNFMFERGRHVTTNYWRGELIPINSQATVVSMGKKKMVLSIDGRQVGVLNNKRHSRKTLQEIADRMLSDEPVIVGGPYAKDIKFGELRLGMNKADAIKARGYPPGHKTYSTESDRWAYWSSRFVRRTIIFENNRLVVGRGLR